MVGNKIMLANKTPTHEIINSVKMGMPLNMRLMWLDHVRINSAIMTNIKRINIMLCMKVREHVI